MSNRPYNVYYNNLTGRVVIQKNDRYISPSKKNICNCTFQKKMDELSKSTNNTFESINDTDNINIYKDNPIEKKNDELSKSINNTNNSFEKKNDELSKSINNTDNSFEKKNDELSKSINNTDNDYQNIYDNVYEKKIDELSKSINNIDNINIYKDNPFNKKKDELSKSINNTDNDYQNIYDNVYEKYINNMDNINIYKDNPFEKKVESSKSINNMDNPFNKKNNESSKSINNMDNSFKKNNELSKSINNMDNPFNKKNNESSKSINNMDNSFKKNNELSKSINNMDNSLKKKDELSKSMNTYENTFEKKKDKLILKSYSEDFSEDILYNAIENKPNKYKKISDNYYIDSEHILNNVIQNNNKLNNESIIEKNLIYGIKKTILSDFNYLYQSSNSNDFKISINKNYNKDIFIYDSFYLFPNISEINTKTETNIINEKKIEMFNNKNNIHDIQYFPIDFIPCGVNIPLKSPNKYFNKIIIKNIFWNIFQTINSKNYESDELLCIVPNKNDFIYKKINIQINFELHSQISKNISKIYNDKILPYKNDKIKYSTPANSCIYKVLNISIDKLNGSYFKDIEIELLKELCIDCALLCLRISVPNESIDILKGYDKNNNLSFGNIPFSQFIINFDYELI